MVRSPSPSNKSYILEEKSDCNGHEFSDIHLLATVACNSGQSNDIAPIVGSLPAEEFVVKEQDALTLSTHVKGNDSSVGTVDVSQIYVAVDSSDQVGQGKNDTVAPQKSSVEYLCNDLADEHSEEHNRGISRGVIMAAKKINNAHLDESSTERPKTNMEAGESENLEPENGGVVKVSDKLLFDDHSGKNNKRLKNVRLHWDLNVSMDAWGQPFDVEDEAYGRDEEGEIKESISPKESKPIEGNKEHMVGVIASDGHANSQSPFEHKSEATSQNVQNNHSGYDSEYEEGEIRESYTWEETKGDRRENEDVDYGIKDFEKGILAEMNFKPVKYKSGDAPRIGEANERSDIEKHVMVCMNDSQMKKGFASKPFKELPLRDVSQRRRVELNTGPDKFVGQNNRSEIRMRNKSLKRGYFGSWDSKQHFSPNYYKPGSFSFGRPQPRSMVDDPSMMNGFNQSRSEQGPSDYVRRQFSDGGYRGRFRRFPHGRGRDCKGSQDDTNQVLGQMHNQMRKARGNSLVSKRLHYPQSDSRSRSRSPASWKGQNISHPRPGGVRANERMMERVMLSFPKQSHADQDMGFMLPPRNIMPSPRFFEGRNNDAGENHNSFREKKLRHVGNSIERVNPDNNNNNHFRLFIHHKRFEGTEENIGGNRFEMVRQSKATEDDDNNNLDRSC
ncbi:hypothetical protein AALP_AA6G128900 [Arabis alpina]|uniref:Btz domain-containing protein n=1 Tax=Arabis alpina TaxID=50452 RepID=A0A087GNW6_ARAAL|nr:hypothetical protein AALP_AA6G128900 [Arabis alpina]